MIEKTSAVVLRIAPFSRTSHVVTWLTPDHGRVATVVKGACRPRSPFLGQYDLFYTCELLFYSRDRNGLHVAKECAPLTPRPAFRTAWRSCAAASYVCDLVSRVTPYGHGQPELFALTEACLDTLARERPTPSAVFWFELSLMQRLGWAPQLDRCAACRKDLSRRTGTGWSCRHGGVLCRACAAGHDDVPVAAPDALAMLRSWKNVTTPQRVRATRCSPRQCLELRTLLGAFLTYHLDTSLPSRDVALDMLALDSAGLATAVQGVTQ